MKRYRSYNSRNSAKTAFKPRSVRNLERKARNRLILSVVVIFIFGYLLLNWGLPGLINTLSFVNKPKHQTTPTQSSVEDPAVAPPVLNIPFEATNSSTLVITGYASPKNRVEIYIDNDLKDSVIVSDNGSFTTNPLPLSLGTNNIFGKTIEESDSSSTKQSLPSKTIKLTYTNEKPNLEVTEPNDGTSIKGGDKKVKVSGKTDPQNSITVNGSTIIITNDGNFSTEIPLNDGDNNITIIAQNTVGNTNKIERKVNYSPQ